MSREIRNIIAVLNLYKEIERKRFCLVIQGYLKEKVLLLFLLRQRSRIDEEDEAIVKKQKAQCCEFFFCQNT